MIKPKSINNYVKTKEEYDALFDGLVKTELEWWESQSYHEMANPTEEDLKKMKSFLEEHYKREVNDEEVEDVNRSFHMLGSVVNPMAVKDFFETKRAEKTQEWLKRDQEKEKRLLETKPLENIKCQKCETTMEYLWSDLYDRGTPKNPDEQVMFAYQCPKDGSRKIFFENGDPWIVESDNNCAICKGDRKATVTEDKENKKYIIYECIKCGSKQVENV